MSKSAFYIVASLAGLYVADVELNHGRAVDSIGFYNWNRQSQPVVGFSDKLDNIGASYGRDSIKDTLNKAPTIANDVRDKALDVYNDAYTKLLDAQHAVTSSGKESQKDAEKHYQEAKKHFEAAKQHLSQFGADAVEDAQKNINKAGNKVYDAVTGIASGAQDQLNNIGSYFVDKYHDLYDSAGNLLVTSQEKAQELADYYQEEAKKAKKQYEDTQASVIHWRDAQSEQVQAKAKANYEAVEAKSEKAHKELHRWIEKARKDYEANQQKAYNYANDAKKQVNNAAYDAKEKVKDNANYVYNKADKHAHEAYNKADKHAHEAYNYAKDSADQAVVQAQDHADSAKGYLADTAGYLKDKYNSLWDSLGRLTVTSQEKAQEIVDYYDEQLALAKRDYENTQSSWLHWRKAKSAEIQLEARRNYEYLLQKDSEARKELNNWIAKAKADAENVVDKAKGKKSGWFS